MKTYHVECQSPHESCYVETVEASDEKSAKKLVAASAKANGFHPNSFKATEIKNPTHA